MAVLNVKEESIRWAVAQLQQKCEELGRLPQKADFDEGTRARIKSFLGPWPRALEQAGLKPPKARVEGRKGCAAPATKRKQTRKGEPT